MVGVEKMSKEHIRNNGFVKDGGTSKMQEGWIKKGGVNNPPVTPRPSAPQGMNPKPTVPPLPPTKK